MAAQAAAAAQRASVFQDVAEGSAYEGYINFAYANGLIDNTDNNCFNPDAPATQLDAAIMLLRLVQVPRELLDNADDYSAMAVDSGGASHCDTGYGNQFYRGCAERCVGSQ